MIIAKFLQKIVGKYESNSRPLKKKIGPIQTRSLENCLHREIELKCDLSELWEQSLRHKYDISYALEDNTKLQAKKISLVIVKIKNFFLSHLKRFI